MRSIRILFAILLMAGSVFGQSVKLGGNVSFGSSSNPSSGDILANSKPYGSYQSAKLEYQALSAGGTVTLVNYSGSAGYVSSLWIGLSGTDQVTTENSTINIYYDGSSTPDISMPVASFFGSAYWMASGQIWGSKLFGGNMFSGGAKGYMTSLPMPFASGIKITITNADASNTGTVWGVVTYNTGVADNWTRTRYLHAKYYYNNTGCTANSTVTLMNETSLNQGRYVGMAMFMRGDLTSSWSHPLEGNIAIYLDGHGSPDYESSGTEDYFMISSYFYGATTGFTQGDQAGVTITRSDGIGAFRYHLSDPVPFQNALKLTWQCGDTSQASFTGTPRFYAIMWYYTE